MRSQVSYNCEKIFSDNQHYSGVYIDLEAEVLAQLGPMGL